MGKTGRTLCAIAIACIPLACTAFLCFIGSLYGDPAPNSKPTGEEALIFKLILTGVFVFPSTAVVCLTVAFCLPREERDTRDLSVVRFHELDGKHLEGNQNSNDAADQ